MKPMDQKNHFQRKIRMWPWILMKTHVPLTGVLHPQSLHIKPAAAPKSIIKADVASKTVSKTSSKPEKRAVTTEPTSIPK